MSALLQGEVTDYGRLIILGMAVAHQDHLNQMSASESEHEVEDRPQGVWESIIEVKVKVGLGNKQTSY